MYETRDAEEHWQKLVKAANIKESSSKTYSAVEINNAFEAYKKRLCMEYGALLNCKEQVVMQSLRKFGIENKIGIKLLCQDINMYLEITYHEDMKVLEYENQGIDFKINSEDLIYAFRHEYGHFSVDIGAVYEPIDGCKSQAKWFNFFSPQTQLRGK